MKRSSSFGEPKPLPGQPGYKLSQTVVLEKDAKEMEDRLKMLQERLEKQRLEDLAVPKPGGSRWNSARVDKGSVLTYNKDLQEKYKKKVESQGGGDPALWITSTNKKEKRRTESHINYMNKDVKDWTMLDVSHWLIALNLEEYEEIFKVNQINGKTSQGKSNVDAKKSNKIINEVNTNESKDISNTYITSEAITKSNHNNNLKSHWSQLEPISSNVLISKPNDSAINAADSDVLDEEAEKLLFQQAVLEWRNSIKSEDSKQLEPLVDSLCYFKRKRSIEVLDLISRVLNFNEDQKITVGLKPAPVNIISNIFKTIIGSNPEPVQVDGDNLAELWVNYLLTESETIKSNNNNDNPSSPKTPTNATKSLIKPTELHRDISKDSMETVSLRSSPIDETIIVNPKFKTINHK
eukprot:gene17856-23469_t